MAKSKKSESIKSVGLNKYAVIAVAAFALIGGLFAYRSLAAASFVTNKPDQFKEICGFMGQNCQGQLVSNNSYKGIQNEWRMTNNQRLFNKPTKSSGTNEVSEMICVRAKAASAGGVAEIDIHDISDRQFRYPKARLTYDAERDRACTVWFPASGTDWYAFKAKNTVDINYIQFIYSDQVLYSGGGK